MARARKKGRKDGTPGRAPIQSPNNKAKLSKLYQTYHAGEPHPGKVTWKNKPSYHPDFCESVVKWGSIGMGKSEMAMEIGISRKKLEMWCDEHADFAEACDIAHDASLAWFERTGRLGLKSNLNANLYTKIMASRFRQEYGEKLAVGGDGPDNPIVSVIRREVVKAKVMAD